LRIITRGRSSRCVSELISTPLRPLVINR
jgi:hypothetical protein